MFTRYDIMGRGVELCENSAIGTPTTTIITPQCWGAEATHEVTIVYNPEAGDWSERDTFHLCRDCAQHLRADAKKHGYHVTLKRIRG